MHTTTFAALANMSPHTQHLHQYAAQRMVGMVHILGRKFDRISHRIAALQPGVEGASGPAGEVTVATDPAPAVDEAMVRVCVCV